MTQFQGAIRPGILAISLCGHGVGICCLWPELPISPQITNLLTQNTQLVTASLFRAGIAWQRETCGFWSFLANSGHLRLDHLGDSFGKISMWVGSRGRETRSVYAHRFGVSAAGMY